MSHTYYLTKAPPSLNNAFPTAKNGRRYRSKDYDAWITGMGWEMRAQGVRPVTGPYGLTIEIGRGLSKADVDNLIKPISDLMVKMGPTEDDARMEAVGIERRERPDVRVTVFAFRDGIEMARMK